MKYALRTEQALLEGWDPVMTDAQLGNIIAHYSGMVTQVDTWFGKVLDKIDALPQCRRTDAVGKKAEERERIRK